MKFVVCLLSALGSMAAVEALPATHSLADGRLHIEVMDPTASDRYNRGVRFTNVAAVLRATYAGQSFLYAPAKHDPIADHGGLASEFDLCIPGGPAEHLPPGWSEAAEGGGFLKIGVGVLEKKGKTYHLFHQPRLLQAADTTVVWQDSSAVFTQVCAGSDGYAYELGATLTVHDPAIVIDWSLANTGAKAFTTRTYTHNFLRLADRDAGPGYVLSFPYPITVQGALAEQTVGARDIAFTARIPTWVNMVVAWPQAYQGENTCTLSHPEAGLSLTCATSMACDELAIHARAGYISPEQFIRLSLAPGDRATWTRTWTLNVR
jgi:hypothetical protein